MFSMLQQDSRIMHEFSTFSLMHVIVITMHIISLVGTVHIPAALSLLRRHCTCERCNQHRAVI